MGSATDGKPGGIGRFRPGGQDGDHPASLRALDDPFQYSFAARAGRLMIRLGRHGNAHGGATHYRSIKGLAAHGAVEGRVAEAEDSAVLCH